MTELDRTTDCIGTCNTCPAVGSCADRVVCRCQKITEETIITAIRTHGLQTLRELKTVTAAGDGCTCCHKELKVYLEVYAPASSALICSAK